MKPYSIDFVMMDRELTLTCAIDNIPYKLSPSKLRSLYKTKTCGVSGALFTNAAYKRIILVKPSKGYVKGNVLIVLPAYVHEGDLEAHILEIELTRIEKRNESLEALELCSRALVRANQSVDLAQLTLNECIETVAGIEGDVEQAGKVLQSDEEQLSYVITAKESVRKLTNKRGFLSRLWS